MLLAELEKRFIKPLPKSEKLQLIADITKMLQLEDERLEKYFDSGVSYPVMTPTITPDDASDGAAYLLQKLWEENNR